MTAIGRFALKSETISNPSIPTFFIALSNNNTKKDQSSSLSLEELEQTWKSKKMFEKHPRFSYCISKDYFFHTKHPFSIHLKDYMKESMHYSVYRNDLRMKIENMLLHPLDLSNHGLWEGYVSSGTLGSSGAIPFSTVKLLKEQGGEDLKETVILFRAHHSMADGVSLANVITDISDESEMIQGQVSALFKKQKKKQSFWERLTRFLYKLIHFWIFGSMKALVYHGYLLLTTNAIPHSDAVTRSVSWCNAAPVEEVKQIIQMLAPGTTINDVFVSCVSAAILQQMKENQKVNDTTNNRALPPSMNIVIPVHLTGGIVPPGESMGNRIGAMVVNVPGNTNNINTPLERLTKVSQSINTLKSTPSPFLSYHLAKLFSIFSSDNNNNNNNNALTQKIIQYSNANSLCVISNVRGPTFPLHIQGKEIHSMVGFLPLPPGIPIGVVVQSYNGMISLSVTSSCEEIIPDVDRFLRLVLMEYGKLFGMARERQMAGVKV